MLGNYTFNMGVLNALEFGAPQRRNRFVFIGIKKKIAKTIEMPKEIKKVKYGSLKSYYELATAKIWIDNVRNYKGVDKKKAEMLVKTLRHSDDMFGKVLTGA